MLLPPTIPGTHGNSSEKGTLYPEMKRPKRDQSSTLQYISKECVDFTSTPPLVMRSYALAQKQYLHYVITVLNSSTLCLCHRGCEYKTENLKCFYIRRHRHKCHSLYSLIHLSFGIYCNTALGNLSSFIFRAR